MKNITQRALTGTVFVVVLVASAALSNRLLSSIFLLFTIIGTLEYLKIVKKDSDAPTSRPLSIALSAAVFLGIGGDSLFQYNEYFLLLIMPLVATLFIVELFRLKARAFDNVLHALLPSLYIALPFALFVSLPSALSVLESEMMFTWANDICLIFFFCLWSNDTGAYLVGKSMGKRKLFPKISPNKTWEGSIGGVVLCILVAGIAGYNASFLSIGEWLIFGAIVAIFGSLGDLVISMLKRNYEVKDTGRLLPGHGGVLDRFDGLLLAAPMVYSMLAIRMVLLSVI